MDDKFEVAGNYEKELEEAEKLMSGDRAEIMTLSQSCSPIFTISCC